MNEYSPDAFWLAAKQVQPGDPRMRVFREACTAAEQYSDYENAYFFHQALIKESVFTGDRYQAIVDFPQLLHLADTHSEIGEQHAHNVLWTYKWILEASNEFYQIELDQIMRWLADYRQRLIEAGFTLHSYYKRCCNLYFYTDHAMLLLAYEDLRKVKIDRMSDSLPDEIDSMVEWELAFGHREKAMELANKIFDHGWKSDEIPATTYGYLLEDAMVRRDADDALCWAAQLKPLCEGSRFRMEDIGKLLCWFAWQNPGMGLRWLQKQQPLREDSRNPFLCFWFDRGAAMLLDHAAKSGLSMGEKTPEMLMAESRMLHDAAAETAARFDARNGSDFFTARLNLFRDL